MTKNDIYTYLAKSRKYVWEYISMQNTADMKKMFQYNTKVSFF